MALSIYIMANQYINNNFGTVLIYEDIICTDLMTRISPRITKMHIKINLHPRVHHPRRKLSIIVQTIHAIAGVYP